jgi:hypothetical protein
MTAGTDWRGAPLSFNTNKIPNTLPERVNVRDTPLVQFLICGEMQVVCIVDSFKVLVHGR